MVPKLSGWKESTHQFLKEAELFLTLKSRGAISWVGLPLGDMECCSKWHPQHVHDVQLGALCSLTHVSFQGNTTAVFQECGASMLGFDVQIRDKTLQSFEDF